MIKSSKEARPHATDHAIRSLRCFMRALQKLFLPFPKHPKSDGRYCSKNEQDNDKIRSLAGQREPWEQLGEDHSPNDSTAHGKLGLFH
jgi:hypothetical protein